MLAFISTAKLRFARNCRRIWMCALSGWALSSLADSAQDPPSVVTSLTTLIMSNSLAILKGQVFQGAMSGADAFFFRL